MRWRACRIVRFHLARCESAARCGDSDAARRTSLHRRRWRSCSPEPRSPGRSHRRPCCEPASACSATFCRAAWWIWWARIRPTRRHSRAGCWARSADRTVDSAIAATVAANQRFDRPRFAQGQLSCASALSQSSDLLPPVSITAVPDGKLHAPYFMQWSFALEQQIGKAMNLRAQYVGTRAVNQPYETQVNGYQTVCQGCFAPFPYGQPIDPRFGAVTQLSTGANSHYNGLQLTADKRLTHGLQVLANYTWSRCMDTVSNGGFLPFSAGAILSPLPGELGRQYGPCDYDVRDNFTAQYVYQLPFKARNRALGRVLNGWQVSGTAFWHSGVPFSVSEHAIFGERKRHRARQRPAVCERGSGRAAVRALADRRRDAAGNDPVAQSRTRSFPRSTPAPAPAPAATIRRIASSAISAATLCAVPISSWSDFYLTKWFQLREHVKLRIDGQVLQRFQSSELRASESSCTREFRASLPPRRDSARSATPLRRRQDCWALDWAATVRRE